MSKLIRSLKKATGTGSLMTLTVDADGSGIDEAVFLVRMLSAETEDTELIAVCSYADMETYDTVPAQSPYRVSTITVMAATDVKAAEMWAALNADVQLNFVMQVNFVDLLSDEELSFDDATDTAGPFVFGDPGEQP